MIFQRAPYIGIALVLSLATVSLPPSSASGSVVGCSVGPGSGSCAFLCPPVPITLLAVAYGGSDGATITGTCGVGTAACTALPQSWCNGRAGTFGSIGVCTLVGAPDAFGVCRNIGVILVPRSECLHSSPHSHTYGTGGSAGARSDQVTGGEEVGAGVVTVTDTNEGDCDGDGIAGDFDGDYDSGVGGGFFGFGPWADEPTCQYGLALHGASVVVNDVVWGNQIAFVIGADDTTGPAVSVDPVDGSTSCSTSGSITPGDPATDPTADADDCLSQVYVGSGTTCGAGGDGGYWVFLSGALVTEDPDGSGTGVNNAPTTGTITA